MTASAQEDLAGFAVAKLTRVLGERVAQRVFEETLQALELPTLASAQDLYAFGDHLVAKGGMEGAVGGLLTVAALLRGAQSPAARR